MCSPGRCPGGHLCPVEDGDPEKGAVLGTHTWGSGRWKQPPRERGQGREPGPRLKRLRHQPEVQGLRTREAKRDGASRRKDSSNKIIVNYNCETGLDASFLELNPNMSHINEYKKNLKMIQEIVENISKLKNVNVVKLDRDGMVICQVYKLFYDEDPDLSKDIVHIKIQIMMYILLKVNLMFDLMI